MLPGALDPAAVLAGLIQRPEWHQRSACRGLGAEAFVIPHGSQYGPTRVLCESCRVRQECLDTALADPSLAGLWAAPHRGSVAPT